MKNYKKIPFNQIKDIASYVERKLKNGHVIIQILVNEDYKEIDELISYANDKECKSYYRSLTDSDDQLRSCVITERLEPYYAYKDTDESENASDIDIESDSQNVIGFSYFKNDFAKMEKYYDGRSFQYPDYEGRTHYEFYISIDKGDIENFGGCMETDFVAEWMTEMGYCSKEM